MKRKIALLLCCALFCLCFVSCGSDKLTGKVWNAEDMTLETLTFPKKGLEFFSDGTGTSDNISFEWTAEDGRLKLTYAIVTTVYDYSFEDGCLILTNDGTSVKYIAAESK